MESLILRPDFTNHPIILNSSLEMLKQQELFEFKKRKGNVGSKQKNVDASYEVAQQIKILTSMHGHWDSYQ